MDSFDFRTASAELKAIYLSSGVRAALGFLNGLTSHRFTALYRFDDQMLTNLYFFDRHDPSATSSPQIPVLASYCVFVRSSSQMFRTVDALRDERVADHPKRQQIQSYCGVPLCDESGRVFGTICHFDFDPMGISDAIVALMEFMGALLSKHPELDKAPPHPADALPA
ncbi:MAG: GAF domain-containing protein [Phycisphaerales bacterium]|nr:GAF domain-containing protein [Phycisphaerales bacterium]